MMAARTMAIPGTTNQAKKENAPAPATAAAPLCHHVSQLHHTCHTPHWPGRGPRKPTKAHSSQEGQRRPTKRRVVWALGVFFLELFFSVLLTTMAPNDADTLFGPFHRFGFHLPPTNES